MKRHAPMMRYGSILREPMLVGSAPRASYSVGSHDMRMKKA